MKQTGVVLGGYGTYGSLFTEQLAQLEARVVIAGRDLVKGQSFAEASKVEFVVCDVRNRVSLRKAIAGASLVINASGPFQAKDYMIPRTCIEQGCHYIDLGDGREYVAGVSQIHEHAKAQNVFVCVGASTAPAITSAMVTELRPYFRQIDSIKIALNAGNKNQAGVSTIASILTYVGAPMQLWQNNHWQKTTGWAMGEFVKFPKPVGKRRVQVCDVPDLELFPQLLGAETVVFKAGVELTLLNYFITGLAQLRKLYPSINLPALAETLVYLSRSIKFFGTWHGSLAIWVTGKDGQEKSLALVAPNNGQRIPSAPAVLLARKVLTEGVPAYGACPCVGFLNLQEFVDYLAQFSIFAVRGKNGVWLSG